MFKLTIINYYGNKVVFTFDDNLLLMTKKET